MVIETKVGASTNAQGSKAELRSAKDGSLVVTGDYNYQESVLNGNVYIGANLGGTPVTTQAGLSATTPALTLYNPIGSGVNLHLIGTTIDITTSPAAAAGLMLAYNLAAAAAPTLTTLANVTNAMIGTLKLPIGQCARVATLAAAPLAFRFLGGTTGASGIGATQLIDKINGEVIITPGVAISIQSTSAAAILASITWEEKTI